MDTSGNPSWSHVKKGLTYLATASITSLAFARDVASSIVTPETLASCATVVIVTILAVIACVVAHYEALSLLTARLRHIQLHPRQRILVLIFAILITHVVEIWLFGGAYYLLTITDGHGALLANHAMGFLDSIYFSAVCYTTLGLGDIVPSGAIRFLVGTEALTGFVLITWSASFTFVEMQRFWKA
jgi:hypothetical protein